MFRDPVLLRLLLMLLLPAAGLGVALGGVWLFRAKRYRVRQCGTPHCARCNYNLTGMAEFSVPRCPECGAALDVVGNVLAGPRVGSPLAALGLLLVVVGAGVLCIGGYRVVRKTDWYHFASNQRVLRDLRAVPTAMLGLQLPPYELYARVATGRLGDAEVDEFLEYLLQQQLSAPPGSLQANCYVPWLSQYYEAGRLSPEQAQRYLAQACYVSVRVRAEVPPGMPVPVRIDGESRVHGNLLMLDGHVTELRCDGAEAVLREGDPFVAAGAQPVPRVDLQLAPLLPGEHHLAVRVQYELRTIGPATGKIGETPVHRGSVQLGRDFRVLATRPAQLVRPITDPGYASAVDAFLQSLELNAVLAIGGEWRIEARSSGARDLPVHLAFDVEASRDSWRVPLGRLVVRAKSWFFSTTLAALPPDLPAEFWLDLRPSEDAALSTPDMDEYWGVPQRLGPLRLRNVEWYEQLQRLMKAASTEPHETSPAAP